MINNGVECCVNSDFWTVCWAHLLCNDLKASGWKLLKAPFYDVILDGATMKLDLKHHHLMQEGMAQWQQLRKGGTTAIFLLSCLGGWAGWEPKRCSKSLKVAIKPTMRGSTWWKRWIHHSGITLPVVLWQHLPTPTPFELVLQNWMK